MCRITSAVLFCSLFVLVLQALETKDDSINFPETVAGKLIFRQMEGNTTYLRSYGELATDTVTEVSFELIDPGHLFRSAKFTYMWDLGNGEVIAGKEPYLLYNYTSSGNYTLRLKVGISRDRQARLTRIYSMDLKVLDAIRNIEFMGPSNYQVAQNSSLSLFVSGSPPMWLCWSMVLDCVSAFPGSCHSVKLYGNTFSLNYNFQSAGSYCLNLTARNDISFAQTSYSIFVGRDFTNNLLFILPCATFILASLIFITATVCRLGRGNNKSKIEVANFSFSLDTNIEIKPKDFQSSPAFCSPSSSRKEEFLPLIRSPGESSSSYVTELCAMP